MGRGKIQPRHEPPRTRQGIRRPPRSNEGLVDEDISMPDADASPRKQFTFIVAIDYGTTYTSVSFTKFDSSDRPDHIDLRDIETIANWPKASGGPKPGLLTEVPSESWYAEGQHYWGFEAFSLRQDRYVPGTTFVPGSVIVGAGFCPKILLAERTGQDSRRQDLRRALEAIGKDETEIVTDYLVGVLEHTKKQLIEYEQYNETCEVELVLCVPAAWDAADRRGWQEITGTAAQRACFGSIWNFWMLHEPEAATAFVLEDQARLRTTARFNWKKDDTFIVCDAGGGTVDTITYKIDRTNPPRVTEVTKAQGSHCGSKYINDSLQSKVLEILRDETYLETNQQTLEHIVNKNVMYQFETDTKQNFSVEDQWVSFKIDGLKPNTDKHFEKSLLHIPRSVMLKCFNERVNGVIELVHRQHEAANRAVESLSLERRRSPTKILLVGGFGNSRLLQNSLRREFPEKEIVCSWRSNLSTMVSQGAVIRAVNKMNAPHRLIDSNYGIFRYEEFNESNVSYKFVGNNYENGLGYLETIDWLIKKNQKVAQLHRKRCQSYRIFKVNEPWRIHETVYVSDEKVKDHIPYDEGCNESAIVVGELVVDLSFLKEEGRVEATRRHDTAPWYWRVDYDLVMQVEGFNLKFWVEWPEGQLQGNTGVIAIPAAFKPGIA